MANSSRITEDLSGEVTPTGATRIQEITTSVGEKTSWPEPDEAALTPHPPGDDLDRLDDRYEVYEEIARGGMASVHLGRSIEPGAPRVVAIKKLHADLAADPRFVAMFVDEARMSARVHHPNVVAPRESLVRAAHGELCLVMEYVHGDTLSHLVARAIRRNLLLPPTVAVGMMVGVLRGLHAAHEATTDDGMPLQMVHRDVSPQNIMIGTDGLARILDFGVAKSTKPEGTTNRREIAGKPGYQAPEQLRYEPVDRRADIFAAGVVLWELLAGRRLFRHNEPRVAWVNILSGEIPAPSHFNTSVSPALDAVVLRALERDCRQRYLDARTFASALAEALPPASTPEVGNWVKHVSGYLLTKRAARIVEIMTDQRITAPAVAPSRARLMADLLPRTRRGQRWTVLGLALVAVASLAPSAGFPRGPGQWAALSTANAAAQSSAAVVVPLPPEALAAPAAEIPTPAAPTWNHDNGTGDDKVAADPRADNPADRAPVNPPLSERSFATDEAVVTAETGPAVTPAPNPRRPSAPAARANGRAAALAEITELHNRALAAYDRANYETSRRLLRAALTACARARLLTHPIAAATHVYLGVVLVGGFKQPELAIVEFRQALKINSDTLLSSRYATPAMAAVFEQAMNHS